MTWQAWIVLYLLVALVTAAFFSALGVMAGDRPSRAETAREAILWPLFWADFLLALACEFGDMIARDRRP